MARFRFTKLDQEAFLEHVRAGMRRGAAADALGLNRRKVREYIAAHPEFERAVEDAEVDATEHVEESLYQAAVSGSVSAAKIWLELKGAGFSERRGRPPKPMENPPAEELGDMGNVTVLDPRRRKGR